MTRSVWEFPLSLPRNAFTAREVPRAGDIWRACQDVATTASMKAGWPPERFRDEGTSFLVYRMSVVHAHEPHYGQTLDAKTWVSRFRRRTLCTRQIRLRAEERLVAAATQEWAHVDGATLKPKQASEGASDAFPEAEGDPSVVLPAYDQRPGTEHAFEFQMWQTWSDPLEHANHPAYIDWCDESTSRFMLNAGLDPIMLKPLAEHVVFRNSVLPGEVVEVRTARVGVIATDAIVLKHHIETEIGAAADATTIRSLADGGARSLIEAWD